MFRPNRIKLSLQYLLLIFLVSASSVVATYWLVREDILTGFKATHEDLVAHNIVADGHRQLTSELFAAHEAQVMGRMLNQGWYIFGGMILATILVASILAYKAFDPIEQTYEAQANFIADASHELKTPLTGLMTRTETALVQTDLTAKQLRLVLKKNLASIRHLHLIIKNLLDLTRIELGKISLNQEWVNLHELVGHVLEDVQARFADKQIVVQTHIATAKLQSDPAYLRQLITVLVENAFKYTPSGGKVEITLDAAEGKLFIKVADTGRGIAQGAIPHVYRRFYRAGADEEGSFGMGLALAARLVKAWGGTIGLSSKPGLGSTFTITLPLATT